MLSWKIINVNCFLAASLLALSVSWTKIIGNFLNFGGFPVERSLQENWNKRIIEFRENEIIIFMVEKNEFFAIKINNSFLRMKNKMNLKCSNLVMVKVNRRF